MKIERITTHVLRADLGNRSFAYSQNWYGSRSATIVEVECDNGIIGYGEAFGPVPVNALIIDHLYTPRLLGRDPLERETLWLELYNTFRDHGPKGFSIEALSAVDIALWDIAGKHFGVPVHVLAGRRYRSEIQAYATCIYRTSLEQPMSSLVEEVERQVADGFSAVKLKTGFGVEADIEVINTIRKTVGDSVDIMIDANHAYDSAAALRIARAVEDCRIGWFEEPILPEDLEGYRELKRVCPIPLAAGEAEFTRYGFRRWLSEKAVDIIQPDCCVMGGISEMLKVIDMADTWQVRCNPHVWGTGVAIAVGLHLCAMIPPCPPALVPTGAPMLELDRSPNALREEIVPEGLEIRGGIARVPTGPGLGIEVDRDALRRFAMRT